MAEDRTLFSAGRFAHDCDDICLQLTRNHDQFIDFAISLSEDQTRKLIEVLEKALQEPKSGIRASDQKQA